MVVALLLLGGAFVDGLGLSIQELSWKVVLFGSEPFEMLQHDPFHGGWRDFAVFGRHLGDAGGRNDDVWEAFHHDRESWWRWQCQRSS